MGQQIYESIELYEMADSKVTRGRLVGLIWLGRLGERSEPIRRKLRDVNIELGDFSGLIGRQIHESVELYEMADSKVIDKVSTKSPSGQSVELFFVFQCPRNVKEKHYHT